MKHKNREISSFKMLNQLIEDGKIKNPYRFFCVYHPVYEIAVNIDVAKKADEYHIIEKYMDKLVCGYTGEEGNETDRVYIKDRKQLYSLLGLEHQAYEVAERFFEDLVTAGHFIETERGIEATWTARRSVKLQEKHISSTEKQKKLFDAFTMKLLPTDFYDMLPFAVEEDTISQSGNIIKNALWLNPRYISDTNAVEVNRMIKSHTYTNYDLIEKGLPQGYKRMQLDAEGEITLKFFPYYLAVFKNEDHGEKSYKTFRIDESQELKGIYFQNMHYSDVRQTIERVSENMDNRDINHPICGNFVICRGGKACHDEGVSFDYECGQGQYGNYYWEVQDKQIKRLLGLDGEEGFQRQVCKKIAEGDVAALQTYNAGRLLYIKKTEEQKQLLLEAVRNPECDKKRLFEEYLGEEIIQ